MKGEEIKFYGIFGIDLKFIALFMSKNYINKAISMEEASKYYLLPAYYSAFVYENR